MRHVIVIETVDPPEGQPLSKEVQEVLLRAVEIGVTEFHGVCFVHGRFNCDSAIAAVHEMYNAPKWEGVTEALKECRRRLSVIGSSSGYVVDEQIRMADAALAKADGKDSQ